MHMRYESGRHIENETGTERGLTAQTDLDSSNSINISIVSFAFSSQSNLKSSRIAAESQVSRLIAVLADTSPHS